MPTCVSFSHNCKSFKNSLPDLYITIDDYKYTISPNGYLISNLGGGLVKCGIAVGLSNYQDESVIILG